ncbi:MAG TPA: hypothetical protein PKL88_02805 [bacterium]|nr:hypothetical protein [Patescibacteria group bacterium]HNU76619.1 hypothetical protein [bacterium]
MAYVNKNLGFERWGLLIRAVIRFNEAQTVLGEDDIKVDNYLNFGKRVGGLWFLHNLGNDSLQEKWRKFISDESNRIIFSDAQLRGEEEV